MDEFEMKRRIYGYIKEMCHYSQMQVFATSYYQKNYFQMQIDDATNGLISLYMDLMQPQEYRRRSGSISDQEINTQGHEQLLQEGYEAIPDNELISIDNQQVPEQRSFTVEELALYDGTDGKPAYVAVNGTVYDVSSVVRWAGGRHFGMQAGRDLTAQFMGCHQGIMDRLNRLPVVGTLEGAVS